MFKIRQPSSAVDNVILGQVATHELVRGPSYHDVTYNCTITKTGATAGVFLKMITGNLTNAIRRKPKKTASCSGSNGICKKKKPPS
jgi:hypothetical protein